MNLKKVFCTEHTSGSMSRPPEQLVIIMQVLAHLCIAIQLTVMYVYMRSNRSTEPSSQMSEMDIERCCSKRFLSLRRSDVFLYANSENAGEKSSIASDSDFINLFCNLQLLQASKRSVYLGDHKEIASMTPLT